MDSIVTARVPSEVKERVNVLLKRAGHTQTDLVNAAFEYYYETGRLPKARKELSHGERTLRGDEAAAFRRRMGSGSLERATGEARGA